MYYKLEGSHKRKEVGTFPQCQDYTLEGNGRVDDPNSFNNQKENCPIVGNPNIYRPELYKTAKYTDFLSFPVSSAYMFISIEFYNFLKPYIQEDFQSWNIHVDSKKHGVRDYKMLYISYPEKDIIDYSNSTFQVWQNTGKQLSNCTPEEAGLTGGYEQKIIREHIDINNLNEYKDSKKVYTGRRFSPGKPFVHIESISINISDINKDIFRMRQFQIAHQVGYYVSERLKEKIEEKGFTGIQFTPINKKHGSINININK